MKERFRQPSHPAAWEPLLAFTAFALVYGLSAARSFLGGDSGLFALIYAAGGTAHPPGYPLYSAYLRALSWLPAASPAHGASLATALLGAASVALLYAAARRWGLHRLAALFGAASFGLAPHVWTFHSQPEVFALNHLIAAAILWASAPRAPTRGLARVALLGALAGLGLSHHHPIVLMAPVGLWGVMQGLRESNRPAWLSLAAGAAALAAGLLPYAYLVAVAEWDLGWHWRDPNSLGDLAHVFLRRDYGTFQLIPQETDVGAASKIAFWGRSVALDLYVVPVAAALVGAVGGLSHSFAAVRWNRPSRSFVLGLVASLVLAGPVFAALLPRAPEGVNYLFLRRFHLFSEMLVALLAALGAHYALERWLRPRIAAVALVGLVAAAAIVGPREVRLRHDPAVERFVQHTFEPLADDAVVIGSGDHLFFGVEYLQRGLDRRTDIDYVGTSLYAAPWYRRRLAERLDVDVPPRIDGPDGGLVENLLATGRPVYATGEVRDGLFDRWTNIPFGTVDRLYPTDADPPPVGEIFRRNRRLYADFRIAPTPAPPPRTWARDMMEAYARHWLSIAAGMESVGAARRARRAREAARHYAPWIDAIDETNTPGGRRE